MKTTLEMIASHPVTLAVLPLKVEAVAKAEEAAKEFCANAVKQMADAGMDRNAVAPFPYNEHGTAYQVKREKYQIFCRLFRSVKGSHRRGEPDICKVNPKGIKWLIKTEMERAALQYDAFVIKLVKKIGDCAAAKLQGSHVWGYSILTVEKFDLTVERWKTQQIVNRSVNGLLFNQWPSRKVK